MEVSAMKKINSTDQLNRAEVQVGEVVNYRGDLIVCRKSGATCADCYFQDLGNECHINCTFFERGDDNEIYFLKVK